MEEGKSLIGMNKSENSSSMERILKDTSEAIIVEQTGSRMDPNWDWD